MTNDGWGNPVKPVGLTASFRPSDDATTFQFPEPPTFFAVSSLRKAAEILTEVNNRPELAKRINGTCPRRRNRPTKIRYLQPSQKYGTIYAFEVDGFGNHLLMDDANVPEPYRTAPIWAMWTSTIPFTRTPVVSYGARITHTSSKVRQVKALEVRTSATT